jgi:hypothetical protein
LLGSISLGTGDAYNTSSNNEMMLMLVPMRVCGRENFQISESIFKSNNQSNIFVFI